VTGFDSLLATSPEELTERVAAMFEAALAPSR
jgi:hypothetical protein